MASHMDTPKLENFLVHILTPVYRLIEDDTIRDPQMGKAFHLPLSENYRANDFFFARGTQNDSY